MHRSRSVLAAGGISTALVLASVGLAYANGAFGSPATDRVGTFQDIQTQLAPATNTTALDASPPVTASSSTTVRSTSVAGPTSTSVSVAASTLPLPTVDSESHDSSTSVPAVGPTTSRSTAQPSTTARERHDDGHEPPEDPSRDD